MNKTILVGAVALTSLLGLPASSLAALPKFKKDLIVPSKSIGGLTLNSSLAVAKKAWGPGSVCQRGGGCGWTAHGPSPATSATANFLMATTVKHKTPFVVEIQIRVGSTNTTGEHPDFDTPLAALKTASGIGLGSTAAALKHAYPKVVRLSAEGYYLKGPGQSQTSFTLSGGRIIAIAMQSLHLA